MITPVAHPKFVLVRPQLGENIGKAARAMLNFGQSDMALVSPRDGWPNPAAGPAASGADKVLDGAAVFETTEDALAGCQLVFATTVRPRGMAKPIVTPLEAARMMRAATAEGAKSAILFGPERSGLENDEIILADAILTVPVNPEFGSLNLAQAVILTAYELSQEGDQTAPSIPAHADKADKEALFGLTEHLLTDLEEAGFFRSEDRKATQRRMIYNLIQNANMSLQEVNTWRGIVKALKRGSLNADK